MKYSKSVILLLFLLLSNLLWANPTTDSLKIKRLKNQGIILSEFDKEKACILLIKSIETMQKDEISIYRTTEIDKRIKIGKNILKLNDEKL